jgi:alpha/beta hydrolase fold
MYLATRRATVAAFLMMLSAAGLAGCGGASPGATAGATPATSSQAPATDPSPTSSGSNQPGQVSEHAASYDVGGHKLYMTCSGTGSPTVVYVHGWVNDRGYIPHESAYGIRHLLAGDYRVCLYDRRNVGSSETVDAVQTPADMLHDMEQVLQQGGIEPPYILMAASFGGLLAYDYLNHHPDQVEGMVLIDAMFPDELRLDRFLPDYATFLHYKQNDMCCTLEHISEYDLIKGLQKYIGHEPEVPVVYLASKQEPRDQNDYQSPKYDARILDAQAAYVHRFSPGRLEWVDAPHFMEPVVPDVIARAVREVAAQVKP